jgi:hypothetical protein
LESPDFHPFASHENGNRRLIGLGLGKTEFYIAGVAGIHRKFRAWIGLGL